MFFALLYLFPSLFSFGFFQSLSLLFFDLEPNLGQSHHSPTNIFRPLTFLPLQKHHHLVLFVKRKIHSSVKIKLNWREMHSIDVRTLHSAVDIPHTHHPVNLSEEKRGKSLLVLRNMYIY